MDYISFLRELHTALRPRSYLEIGVRWGHSLSVARCPSVGVDPAYSISQELNAEVHLFRTTSDEYFARTHPLAPVNGQPFDLAFIDGMHLFEFALRDFLNAERHSRASGVVVFDDVLPRNVQEAARVRSTSAWTGDVYGIIEVLARYRPEVLAIPIDTEPTGVLVIMGLDPTNAVLTEHYNDILAEFRRPDPQPVPSDILSRSFGQDPRRFLDSGLLQILAEASDEQDSAGLSVELSARAATALGPAYARV